MYAFKIFWKKVLFHQQAVWSKSLYRNIYILPSHIFEIILRQQSQFEVKQHCIRLTISDSINYRSNLNIFTSSAFCKFYSDWLLCIIVRYTVNVDKKKRLKKLRFGCQQYDEAFVKHQLIFRQMCSRTDTVLCRRMPYE